MKKFMKKKWLIYPKNGETRKTLHHLDLTICLGSFVSWFIRPQCHPDCLSYDYAKNIQNSHNLFRAKKYFPCKYKMQCTQNFSVKVYPGQKRPTLTRG